MTDSMFKCDSGRARRGTAVSLSRSPLFRRACNGRSHTNHNGQMRKTFPDAINTFSVISFFYYSQTYWESSEKSMKTSCDLKSLQCVGMHDVPVPDGQVDCKGQEGRSSALY